MEKKNKKAIIWGIVLVAIAALVVVNQKVTSDDPGSDWNMFSTNNDPSNFSVLDTASITKVYLADRMNHDVLLERQADGWSLDTVYRAHPKKIDQLFYTLYRVRVRTPVSLASHDNVIAQMASESVKVEIYQRVPRINLFNVVKLFYHEKCTKVFYVGGASKDNVGTFMLREGSDQPYIVHIPGFHGYLSTRFSADPDDWRDHTVFHESLANIQSVSVEFNGEPERGFRVDNIGKHQYQLISLADNQSVPFDTLKVINLLSAFSDLRFEALLNSSMEKERMDSIKQAPYVQKITLVNKEGRSTEMKTILKREQLRLGIPDEEHPIDHNRMYALINQDRDLVLIQNYIFDKVLKDLSYFKAGNPIQFEIGHYEILE